MSNKLASRKLWICVAAGLASIGASIAGLTIENEVISGIGIVCTVVSAAIYAMCEAYVDGHSCDANVVEHVYNENIDVYSTDDNSEDTVLASAAANRLNVSTASELASNPSAAKHLKETSLPGV